ncbi:erythromycin esterase family protein [Aggregicoccus sp. 17bor-14]|uniref:erythromycin esterase family protein n=1 Tax=Myxococcaceae TaxID=31 RepID=UPI00129C36F2|nr:MULTISPECIES: erythromycin esterase family protein [Myxococcaceae]MBF5041526.1 erythromycin esterase family protein [Simulacricoccus sp. 17bor-14]MRI87311.1 erythromycin esterase family protein [Aggregicoccus sp. 17bor-14]
MRHALRWCRLLLLLAASACSTPPSPQEQPDAGPDPVSAWVRETALPLSGVEAGQGFADLAPLAPQLSGARVVALGEATHGTREFFQLKHRLLEYLVLEQGFTAFAIEANFGEALAVDDYVVHGKGSAAAALAGLYFWTWNTEEVLALIEWMRAYNQDPAHARKLHFYGVDMQYSAASASALQAYLEQVDPDALEEVRGWLTPLERQYPWVSVDASGRQAEAAALVAPVDALEQRLVERRASYVATAGEQAYLWATRHARVLAQFLALTRRDDAEAVVLRDQAMAENALWLLEQEGPQGRMVLWAHNFHVSRGSRGYHPMGWYLDDALGEQLSVYGFAFSEGSFRARLPAEQGSALAVHTVAATPSATLDAKLASAGVPLFALNLRALPSEGPVHDFFYDTLYTREVGAVFSELLPLQSVRPAAAYDGLLFVHTSHAAQAVSGP